MRRVLAAAAVVIATAACGRSPSPAVQFAGSPHPASVEVTGLPRADLQALANPLPPERWREILAVRVEGADPSATLPMAGEYAVDRGVLRFAPMYGFDAGRRYTATFDPQKVPSANPADGWRQRMTATLSLPAPAVVRTTSVSAVYPGGETLPENMLRFYIEFTAPMGRGPALPHVRLLDEEGREVVDPFLPVDAELWSPDRTRFTLLFDPGRVKRGIKPNRDLGRALHAGQRYTLVIADAWHDASGSPLRGEHRHAFVAGPAVEAALEPSQWRIAAPANGSRVPLIVRFPWALDRPLALRGLRVLRGSSDVQGRADMADGETAWTFTPEDPWTTGDYILRIDPSLEDPAGNRVGRAFEVTMASDDTVQARTLPFRIQ